MNFQSMLTLATTFCTTDRTTVGHVKNWLLPELEIRLREDVGMLNEYAEHMPAEMHDDVKRIKDAIEACKARLASIEQQEV